MKTSDLRALANRIRHRFLRMHFEANAGHIGSGLSAIDLLAYLYGGWLGPEDKFILSKGHGASAVYATLRETGVFNDQDIATYYKDGTRLPAHPAPLAHSAIPAATGSLGHGLPIAAGMAYSRKHLDGPAGRVAVLLSDGECNEGSVWEAALFAGHHGLDNLHVLVDANGLQGFGRTEEVLGLEPFRKKWEAFGFRVTEIDGHDFARIDGAFKRATVTKGKPHCFICRTVKGKGISFMENKMEWHYLPMKPEQFEQAIRELEGEVRNAG